jgi:hypothetical protein
MPISGDLGAGNFAKSQVVEGILNVDPEKSNSIAKTNLENTFERQKAALENAKLKAEDLAKYAGSPWPQVQPNPQFSDKRGFLPLQLLQPSMSVTANPESSMSTRTFGAFGENSYKVEAIKGGYLEYAFKDWRGQILTDEPQFPKKSISTEDRFKASNKLPRSTSELLDFPHSMRDVPLIFNDTRTDYFKYGLQSIDNLTPIENPENGSSTLRKDRFEGTPWEQNDPVFYGFDIIFDAVSSPLLNGSVNDFINNYAGINEIFHRRRVYEEFKNQFTKFFRTNAKVKVDTTQLAMTSTTTKASNLDNNSNLLNGQSGVAYFSYYIKSISGLDLLIEKNKGQQYSWAPKYKEDMIEIKMAEDVTLSLSTLAHLYKLLYWSRPNGKHLVPENLLRFNCQIVISECRNMNRVRRDVSSGNIEVLKDNLSRWVYNLRDCQFFFDKMPVPNEVDMGSEPKDYDGQSISFDFKYSTQRLERFVPDGKGWGKYVSYDAGAIWKVGNAGNRQSRSTGSGGESSVPNFFVDNFVPKDMVGVEKPYVIAVYGDGSKVTRIASSANSLDIFKSRSEASASEQSSQTSDTNQASGSSVYKAGRALMGLASDSQVKKAKDFAADVLGLNKFSKITQLTQGMNNSRFFDVNGQLSWNDPLNGRSGLINKTIDKLYGGVPGPYENETGNAASGSKTDIFSRNVNISNFLANKLGEDASRGKYTYAGEGPNSFSGKGYLSEGYRPPVPLRSSPNNLATENAQANITYIPSIAGSGYNLKGYQPPLKSSLSVNRGNEDTGVKYVISQVTNFAGGPLSNQIFGQGGPGKG